MFQYALILIPLAIIFGYLLVPRKNEILGPTAGSVFVVMDAHTKYGVGLAKELALNQYRVIGIVHSLKDAEILRSVGQGNISAILDVETEDYVRVESKVDVTSNPVVPELQSRLQQYSEFGAFLYGIVLVMIPRHYYEYCGNTSNTLTGYEFIVSSLHEVIESVITLQTILPEYKGETLRVLIVSPTLDKLSRKGMSSLDVMEIIYLNALLAAAQEARRHFLRQGVTVSIVLSPPRDFSNIPMTKQLWNAFHENITADSTWAVTSSSHMDHILTLDFISNAMHALTSSSPYSLYYPRTIWY